MQLMTKRLWIRPYTEADFEAYYRYIMDPGLQQMLGEHIGDRASAEQTFQWLLQNRTFLALTDRTDETVIGHICLHPPMECVSQDSAFSGKTGFSVSFATAPERQRMGYMEEALRALIEASFKNGTADYFDCEHTPDNIASGALQKKIGFVRWGKESFDGVELIINVLKREAL